MYVVIMGGGRVGLHLAHSLVVTGHDVTLIESDENLCATAAGEIDALIICGNGTDIKTLEESNIEDADVLWRPLVTTRPTFYPVFWSRNMKFPNSLPG